MTKTIYRYGIRGFLVALALFLISFLIGKNTPYSFQEFLGYASIVISLLMIYPAMRHYHTLHPTDTSFMRFLIIGLGITTAVAIGATIADYIYVTVLYPDFISDYTQYMLTELGNKYSGEVLEAKRAELLNQIDTMGQPMVMVGFMFVTVMIIGIIFSLLLSLWMTRRVTRSPL